MKKNFVIFYSPGTFVAETTEEPIDTWDTEAAIEMSRTIKERHGAIPYGFQFITRSRDDNELDSKKTDASPMYYLGGRIETIDEIEIRNDPKEKILRSNMRANGWDRVIVNENSWRTVLPMKMDDVIVDYLIDKPA